MSCHRVIGVFVIICFVAHAPALDGLVALFLQYMCVVRHLNSIHYRHLLGLGR